MIQFVDTGYIDLNIMKIIVANLPSRYQKLDVTVCVDPDEEILETIRSISPEGYRHLVCKEILGCFSTQLNVVFIMPNHYEIVDDVRYRILFTFLHELRHRYQATYRRKKFESHIGIDSISDPEAHNNHWIEKDADDFADRIMKRFFD